MVLPNLDFLIRRKTFAVCLFGCISHTSSIVPAGMSETLCVCVFHKPSAQLDVRVLCSEQTAIMTDDSNFSTPLITADES